MNTTVNDRGKYAFTPAISPFLKLPAIVLSYVFHPIFMPTYIFLLLMWQFPYEFAGITEWQWKMRLFGVFWLTAFFQP